jgi:methionyl-tRNA formyltransferase
MKILYLGYPENAVHLFLNTKGTVYQTQEKITFDISKFDWIVSYGYSHILKQDIINTAKNPIINLHISYLPFNRGADPNFWSWLENTPKGVSIHQIDAGIDTGNIFIQKKVYFDDDIETLSSSYNTLRSELEKLFIENFDNIIKGNIISKKQQGTGTFHISKDLETYKYLLTNGWDTPVKQIKMTDLEIINEIEKVRSKNNVNWMDILRLAFEHAPDKARQIISKINKDDTRISELLKQLSNND